MVNQWNHPKVQHLNPVSHVRPAPARLSESAWWSSWRWLSNSSSMVVGKSTWRHPNNHLQGTIQIIFLVYVCMCTYVYVCIYICTYVCILYIHRYCLIIVKKNKYTPYFTQYLYTIHIYVCMYCNISIYAMLGKYVRWTMLKNTHSILYIVVGKNMYVYIYIYYVNIIL